MLDKRGEIGISQNATVPFMRLIFNNVGEE